MNRYGDSAEGMVESALEFVRIAQAFGHRGLVLSMKASNPLVCIEAYRLLARRMDEEGMDYPFHLGVTEAGDGEDGRVKSAVGIGALLEEGLCDTGRLSLTEDPVDELPVARALVAPYNERASRDRERRAAPRDVAGPREPGKYARRLTEAVVMGPLRYGACGQLPRSGSRDPSSGPRAGRARSLLHLPGASVQTRLLLRSPGSWLPALAGVGPSRQRLEGGRGGRPRLA